MVGIPCSQLKLFLTGKHETAVRFNAKEELREYTPWFYQQPLVQEALYIGSPDLHEQLFFGLKIKSKSRIKKKK